MRIISKFKDYYDSVQAYGMDKTYVYERLSKDIKADTADYTTISNLAKKLKGGMKHMYTTIEGFGMVEHGAILFCGKFYSYVKFSNTDVMKRNTTSYYAYSLEDIDNIVDKFFNEKAKKAFNTNNRMYFSYSMPVRKNFKELFEQSGKEFTEINELLFFYKCPAILVKYETSARPTVKLNPNLGKLEFYRMIDPYTAFQEIARYLDGVIGRTGPETLAVSDEIKRDKHGFDKWSFKKMPKK